MNILKKMLLASAILCAFNNTAHAKEACYIKDGNDVCYSDMQTAIDKTVTNTLTLQDDVTLNLTENKTYVTIGKDMTIDLNGHNIVSNVNTSFSIIKGNVKFTGQGTITSSIKTHSVIAIKGSNDKKATNYTTVTVDKDVTIDGGYGVLVTYYSSSEPYAYGVTVNFNDKANTVWGGLYLNGTVQHTENYPVFNVGDGAVINGGIYLAGYAKMNLGKATINSDSVSLGIKSGILNINGTTINNNTESDLDDKPDTNGIDTSTATIQVASNGGYAGNIEINIIDGTFNSKNGPAFSEYIENGDSSRVTKINITGGTFNAAESQKVFSFSDSFAKNAGAFIAGGTYSSTVDSSFVKDGYIANKNGETYVVEKVKKEINTEEIDTTREATEVTTGIKDASDITETLVESIEKTFSEETKNVNATVEVEIENNKTVAEEVKVAVEEVLNKKDKDIKILEYFDVTLVVKNSDTDEEIGK